MKFSHIPPGQRTFYGAAFAQITATVALFSKHLDGEQWIIFIPTVLTIYAGKSIGETYVKRSTKADAGETS